MAGSHDFLKAAKAMQADADMLKQEAREARVEVEASRKRIRNLVDENWAKDRRINVLEREKAELERRLQVVSTANDQEHRSARRSDKRADTPIPESEILAAPSDGDIAIPSPTKTIRGVGRTGPPPKGPGFTRLSSSHKDWVNIFDNDRRAGVGSQEVALTWRTKKIQTVDLRPVAWLPTLIAPFEGDVRYDVNAARGEEGCDISSGRTSEPTLVSSDLEANKKRKRGPTLDSRKNHATAASRGDRDDFMEPERTMAYGFPPPAKRRSLPLNHPERDGYRRKSVCIRCWLTSSFCDFQGQCRSCQDAGSNCVRRLCEDGADCRNPRCPCLHPGQWDEEDREWVVEFSQMPRKRH